MESLEFMTRIRLCRSMLPVMLLSISLLIFIDSFSGLADNDLLVGRFHHLYNSTSGKSVPITGLELSITAGFHDEHNSLPMEETSDAQLKGYHIILVFCLQMFSTVVNFTASIICLTNCLCSFLLSSSTDYAESRSFHVPFPSKHKWTAVSSTFKYLEFLGFLMSVIGTFGAAMLVTVLVWQYYITFEALEINQTHTILSTADFKLELNKFRVQKLAGVLNAFLSLVISLSLLGSLTNVTRFCGTRSNDWVELETMDSPKPASLTTEEKWQQLTTKALWFCLRLVRTILSLSSILITSGGLLILGSALQWFLVNSGNLLPARAPPSFICYGMSLVGGLFSIAAGLMSVIAVQCCSTPLEIIVTHRTSTSGGSNDQLSWKFNRSFHLLTIFTSLLHIPLALGIYTLLRKDKQTTSIQSDKFWFDSNRIIHMGYVLCYFSNSASILLTSIVLVSLVVDLAVRIRLLEIGPSQCFSPFCAFAPSSTTESALTRIQSTIAEKHTDTLPAQMHYRDSTWSKESGNQMNRDILLESNNNNACRSNHQHKAGILAIRNSVVETSANNNQVDERMRQYTRLSARYSGSHNTTSLNSMPKQNFELKAPQYWEPAKMLSRGQPMYLSESPSNDSFNRSQMVYACNSFSRTNPHANTSSQLARTIIGTSKSECPRPVESCEYMSCELTQPACNTGTVQGLTATDFVVKSSEPIGFYYIDTSGEDFITSV